MPFNINNIDLEFPVLGMDRRLPGKKAQPGVTPNASNVRPDDAEDGRIRGGSRPGIRKSFAELIGSGTRIQHLGQLNTVNDDEITRVFDNFSGLVLDPKWIGGDGVEDYLEGEIIAELRPSRDRVNSRFAGVAELLHEPIGDFNTEEQFTITLTVNYDAGSETNDYSIFFRIPAGIQAKPTGDIGLEEGIRCRFRNGTNGGQRFASMQSWIGGVEIDNDVSGKLSLPDGNAVEIKVVVNQNVIQFYWDDVLKFTSTVTTDYTLLTGNRVGFQMFTVDDFVSQFRMDYESTVTPNEVARNAIAIGSGELWVENEYGVLVLDTGPASLHPTYPLQGIDHLSKYYIADYGDERAAGESATLSADGLTLTDGTAAFDTDGINLDDHILSVYAASNSATTTTLGQYTIASITATTIVLDEEVNTDGSTSDGNVSYRVERGPKVYDPSLAAGSRLVSFVNADIVLNGDVPVGNRLVSRYRDRLCWAGDIHNPHLWWHSRAGVPTDYQYFPAVNNVGRAVAGQNSEAGAIGDLIKAQIVHSDDYMIYASLNSMWVLRGDAAWGGSLDNISRAIGMRNPDAWCHGPNGEIIFLTRDGLYTNEQGIEQPIQSVSREKLPRELRDIDPNFFHVSMVYDTEERGIHLMVSAFEDTTASNHFFISWPIKTFFPTDFNTVHDAFAVWDYAPVEAERSQIIFGCRDGYVREFDLDAISDDGLGFKSIISIGPFYGSEGSTRESIMKHLSLDLDDDSSDIKVTIISGKNHAECIDKSNRYIAERT